MYPDYTLESSLHGLVCGIDEAGRGPLAGDVYAAAVMLPANISLPDGVFLQDSKKLADRKRRIAYQWLCEHAKIGVGKSTVEEIDRLNIFHASMLAMQRAFAELPIMPDHALIDGNQAPLLPCKAYPVVKGDAKSLSIAAASIVAKTVRDNAMRELALRYPYYGFEKHAGYGTKFHKEALLKYGITCEHRKSFAPVKYMLVPETGAEL